MNNTPSKFAAGQIVWSRSACDYDCIHEGEVLKVTASRVTIKTNRPEPVTVKIHRDNDGNEFCFPFGRYSMAAVFNAESADRAPGASRLPENVIMFPH